MKIEQKNHIWQADIIYISIYLGFMCMFAMIDVYNRKIMGWSISILMNAEWCREVVLDTIERHGKPDIFNTVVCDTYMSLNGM